MSESESDSGHTHRRQLDECVTGERAIWRETRVINQNRSCITILNQREGEREGENENAINT